MNAELLANLARFEQPVAKKKKRKTGSRKLKKRAKHEEMEETNIYEIIDEKRDHHKKREIERLAIRETRWKKKQSLRRDKSNLRTINVGDAPTRKKKGSGRMGGGGRRSGGGGGGGDGGGGRKVLGVTLAKLMLDDDDPELSKALPSVEELRSSDPTPLSDLPVTLPLKPVSLQGKVINSSSGDMDIDIDEAHDVYLDKEGEVTKKTSLTTPSKTAESILKLTRDGLMFFQLPPILPLQNTGVQKARATGKTTDIWNKKNPNSIHRLDSGKIGKLRIYKSGKVKIHLRESNLALDVSPGMPSNIHEDVMAIEFVNNAGGVTGNLINLGPIEDRFKATTCI